MLNLEVNKRIQNDPWHAAFLDDCRHGCLNDGKHSDGTKHDTFNQYCFIHGFPTAACGSWMPSHACPRRDCNNTACNNLEVFVTNWLERKQDDVTLKQDPTWGFLANCTKPWEERWHQVLAKECISCQQERARRKRVMGCAVYDGGLTNAECQTILNSERFADSVYITEFNKPVCLYSMLRAKSFAQIHNRQLLWIQAVDFPPCEHFSLYSEAELQKLKMKWLEPTYHAKKTEGVASLLPVVYDMPLKITSGQAAHCREQGIYNGSRCRFRALDLHPEDRIRLTTTTAREFVLHHLPTALWVEMSRPLKDPLPNVPDTWFPLTPITTTWTLDKEGCIEIKRKGFCVVPDFSSTIHSATGRELSGVLPDLGSFYAKPSYVCNGARLYCALACQRYSRTSYYTTFFTAAF